MSLTRKREDRKRNENCTIPTEIGSRLQEVQSNASYLAITVFCVVWLFNIFYGRFWYHCFVLIISFNLIPFLPIIIVPIISMAGSGLWGGIWPGGQFLLGADAKVRGRVIIGYPKFTSSKTAWSKFFKKWVLINFSINSKTWFHSTGK